MCIANGVYCNLGSFSGVYAYQGNTADGKRYCSHNTGANPAVVYLFCDYYKRMYVLNAAGVRVGRQPNRHHCRLNLRRCNATQLPSPGSLFLLYADVSFVDDAMMRVKVADAVTVVAGKVDALALKMETLGDARHESLVDSIAAIKVTADAAASAHECRRATSHCVHATQQYWSTMPTRCISFCLPSSH